MLSCLFPAWAVKKHMYIIYLVGPWSGHVITCIVHAGKQPPSEVARLPAAARSEFTTGSSHRLTMSQVVMGPLGTLCASKENEPRKGLPSPPASCLFRRPTCPLLDGCTCSQCSLLLGEAEWVMDWYQDHWLLWLLVPVKLGLRVSRESDLLSVNLDQSRDGLSGDYKEMCTIPVASFSSLSPSLQLSDNPISFLSNLWCATCPVAASDLLGTFWQWL